jgi:hypothetical protein
MAEIFSFFLPIFATPRNYSQMLLKLAGFALYETYLLTLFLRDIPAVDAVFRSVETSGRLGTVLSQIPNADALNLAGIGLALLVALISHVTHLHDRISDLLGIRHRFDIAHILRPLAHRVGVNLTTPKLNKISSNRDHVMRDVFYRFASSRAENTVVDKHDIEHALAQWSWFWALIEGIVYVGTASIVAFISGGSDLGVWLALIVSVLISLSVFQYYRLPRYATPQIEAIASDHNAALHVRAKFDAL